MSNIRWHQRLENFKSACNQLSSAVDLSRKRALSDLEKQGLIQAFEFTHELAWNLMRDFFQYQGNPDIAGSRDASREAFKQGLISDGDVWMEMIRSRNQTSHTYNRSTADEIVDSIINSYFAEFLKFSDLMNEKAQNDK